MKHRIMLTVSSLLSILLFSIHVTDDIVRGIDRVGPQSVIGFLIMVVWLYGALVLSERRAGLIIVLLGGILAAGVPMLHFSGALVSSREFARSPGAFLFIWTLWALGVTGMFSVVLATRGLWSLRRGSKTPGAPPAVSP